MSDLPHLNRRMSDAEGLMWRLEKDPHLSSTFANVTILDTKPDVERLRRRMERAIQVVPRLRQRVQPAPANLSAPLWVDDPEFDINYHVRHIALPKPGNLRQLLDLSTLITHDPFDRTRPLWQFYVVDGLAKGRSALVQKLHHTITDGEGGVRLSLEFLDFARDAPESPALDADTIAALSDPAPPGNHNDLLRDLFAGSLKLPLSLLGQIKDLLANPTQIPATGNAAADAVRGIVSQLSETDHARSPLWTQRSLHRRLEVLQAPFDATRGAAKRLGGTLNTAFITAAAHAASGYHEQMGYPVEMLRTSMAISTRSKSGSTKSTAGGNAFSLARMLVPTSPMPIADRFEAITNSIHAARENSASASLDALASMAATLPTSVITRLARQQAQTVDFATSNVRASPIPLYVAGAQILENYPVGPLAGVAFNLTLLSYVGSLDMGLHIDSAAVEHPELLRDLITAAFNELAAA